MSITSQSRYGHISHLCNYVFRSHPQLPHVAPQTRTIHIVRRLIVFDLVLVIGAVETCRAELTCNSMDGVIMTFRLHAVAQRTISIAMFFEVSAYKCVRENSFAILQVLNG